MRRARATYRLQLHKDFTFDSVAAITDYLAKLGVSDLYMSPILQARPGSMHGYDIVDHGALNPELGGAEGFARLDIVRREHDLGCLVDIVPNHMGVTGADNAAWLEVLEWGPRADRAAWFDINWNTDGRDRRLLVPVLGEQYGAALENGHLILHFDPSEGSFAVWAYDTHKLPICPSHYGRIISACSPMLARLGDRFENIAPPLEATARKLKAKLAAAAREPSLRAEVDAAVGAFRGTKGCPESWTRLHDLIAAQTWRAAYFKAAADEINYRRFFNVNELAGLRTELDEVFEETHRVIFDLVERGGITGLRIDHIDGLLDPRTYLHRVRGRLGSEGLLVVEKILAGHESLRADWPVDGTTGYEFANVVTGLLVDPAGQDTLTSFYESFTGDLTPFAETARKAKHRIMENELASELHMLARDIAAVAARNPRTADYTRNLLRRALKEVLACFPVYRTYLDDDGKPEESDCRDIAWAVSVARKRENVLDPTVFDFIERLLLGELDGVSRYAVLRCAMKVQQYSGPVMAKSLEDTAFYRNARFLALNEVGGSPEQFGVTPAAFHKANSQRAAAWPRALLATSTHDTKRGEDARARLAVLSEIGDEWTRHVALWSRILRARRGDVEGRAPPDRRDEYAFYQLLVSTWPAELLGGWGGEVHQAYIQRITAAMIKGVREAKQHSGWGEPNDAYEGAVKTFIQDALAVDQGAGFRESFGPFVEQIARWGAHNTLVQTVLKLTVPGIPDLYQGSELWDLSLVDPDNRRPVDFARRRAMLGEIETRTLSPAMLMDDWPGAGFKLAAIYRLLALRRLRPALFAEGSYEPLAVSGEDADRAIAFLRRHEGALLCVVAGRFPSRGGFAAASFAVELPDGLPREDWHDLLSDETLDATAGLGNLGVRVLSREL